MPLWRKELQLAGAETVYKKYQGRLSHEDLGVVEKCNFCDGGSPWESCPHVSRLVRRKVWLSAISMQRDLR